MTTSVRIYHTTNLRDARWEATREAIEVFAYTSDWTDPHDICEEALELFNVGTNMWAAAYRDRHNRSLSIGDLVEVDGVVYELRPHPESWTRRDLPKLTTTSRFGSIWANGPIPTEAQLLTLALDAS